MRTKWLLFFLPSILSSVVFAQDDNPIATIINHFDHPLSYTITINPQVLTDLPDNFQLKVSDKIETRVLDLQKEAYIRVVNDDDPKKNAFFGIERRGDAIVYHGYIGKGIAYSWIKGIITFCTPEEYRKQKHC